MLDQAECIAELDSTNESDKVYKVYNFDQEPQLPVANCADVEMKDDSTTNASPDQWT